MTTSSGTTLPVAPGIVPGFDGKTIVLTNLGTRTNPAFGPIGRSIQGSLESHFAAINARGGIAGRYRVEVRFVETEYDASKALSAYNQVKDSTVGFASVLGTPIVGALLPELDRDGLTASPASGDAEWALHDSLLPVGSTYQVQAINGSEYFWSQYGKSAPMCALSLASSYGDAGAEGVAFAAKTAAATVGPSIRVDAQTASVVPAIQQLAAAGCRGVMLTTTPQQAITAIVAGDRGGFRPRWIFMAPTWSEQLSTATTGRLLEDNAWVMGEGPSYRRDPSNDTPGLFQLVQETNASGNSWVIAQANVGSLFGFGQAKVWEAVLERAVANRDLSRAGIRRASKEIGVVDFGGLFAATDYGTVPRLSNGTSTVFAVDGSWLLGIRALQTAASPSAAAYRKR